MKTVNKMSIFDSLISKIPGISEAKTYLSFKDRLKWTVIILLLFLVLGQITVFGITEESMQRFKFLEIILGSSFGSLMTLGIGPIVTASIILQLMVGSGIIPWDLKTDIGKKKFQGTQKLLTIFFCIFEGYAYVAFGAVQPVSNDIGIVSLVIGQIAFGGFLVLLMDEVISKWGIGSGVSLFIAAGVSKGIFIRAFNPLTPPGEVIPSGLIPQFITMIGSGDLLNSLITILPIFSTLIVFFVVVYVNAIKVEIPLAFGSIRGFSRRWPLQLLYTNTIPIILIAALLANMQLVGSMFATNVTEEGLRCGLLGCFDEKGNSVNGFAYLMQAPRSLPVQMFFLIFMFIIFVGAMSTLLFKIKGGIKILIASALAGLIMAFFVSSVTVGIPSGEEFIRAVVYLLVLSLGATIFSVFWVSTSGMDSRSVANNIENMGMQIPGFRRDPRIVEQVLNRYIPSLAILSGLFMGVLAAFANFTGALGTGTGILLTVMIVYNLYEQISQKYVEDMHPSLRKFFK